MRCFKRQRRYPKHRLESLTLANAMTVMAITRRYALHSVVALGAIEQTAPTRRRCLDPTSL